VRAVARGGLAVDLKTCLQIVELTQQVGLQPDEVDVVLASAGNYIEVWDKAKYEAVLNDPQVDFAKLAEEVMGNVDAAGDVLP